MKQIQQWYRCFGLTWWSDIELHLFDHAPATGPFDIQVIEVESLPLRAVVSSVARMSHFADGFRFAWNDEATFDYHHPGRLLWMRGNGWTGAMPVGFFSTVAAFVVSWQQYLPLHASTIIHNGHAWLIAGNAGAGKSTLTAELIGAGTSLLSDDLTVVHRSGKGDWVATKGRSAMRLHPANVATIPHSRGELVSDDPRGKWLVWPKGCAADQLWPVGGVIWLGATPASPQSAAAKISIGRAMLFRPKLHKAMSGVAAWRTMLLDMAADTPMHAMPPLIRFDDAARGARLSRFLALVESRGSGDPW